MIWFSLQLYQLAELGGLTGLAFADHLGRGLEDADDLALAAAVTVENTRFGRAHHLLNQRHHLIQNLALTFEDHLFGCCRAPLYARANLLRKAPRLADDTPGCLQQTAISPLHLVLVWHFATGCSGDFQQSMLDAATSVAQLGASRTGQVGDALHGTGQHANPIAEQRTIGGIVDIA